MDNIESFDIQKLADSQFNGDLRQAIDYFFRTYSSEDIERLATTFNKEQSKIALEVIRTITQTSEFKKALSEEVHREIALRGLELTKEEVMNAKVNPYKATSMKQFLKLLIMEGGIVALGFAASSLGIDAGLINSAGSILTAYFAYDIGVNVVKYFQFNKLKKGYIKEQSKTQELDEEQLTVGRNR